MSGGGTVEERLARAMCDDELWTGAFNQASEPERNVWLRRASAGLAGFALYDPATHALIRTSLLKELREAKPQISTADIIAGILRGGSDGG